MTIRPGTTTKPDHKDAELCPPFVVTLLRFGEINATLEILATLPVYPGCSNKEEPNVQERHITNIVAEYVDHVTGYMKLHDVGILEYVAGRERRDTVFTDGSILSLRKADDCILFLATNAGPEFPIRRLKDIEPRYMELIAVTAMKIRIDTGLLDVSVRQVFAPPSRREQLRYILWTIFDCAGLIAPILFDSGREF